MLTNETVALEEVAETLHVKPDWLKRNWLKIHENYNFPRKIPTGFVWPRRAVEVWLRSAGQIAPAPLPANQNGTAGDAIAAAAAALRERYGVNP